MTHATETPITDAALSQATKDGLFVTHLANTARDLERRLTAAEVELAEAREWQLGAAGEIVRLESVLRSAGERVPIVAECNVSDAGEFELTWYNQKFAESMPAGNYRLALALPVQGEVNAWRSHDNTGNAALRTPSGARDGVAPINTTREELVRVRNTTVGKDYVEISSMFLHMLCTFAIDHKDTASESASAGHICTTKNGATT